MAARIVAGHHAGQNPRPAPRWILAARAGKVGMATMVNRDAASAVACYWLQYAKRALQPHAVILATSYFTGRRRKNGQQAGVFWPRCKKWKRAAKVTG